jgi:hypothetical protein
MAECPYRWIAPKIDSRPSARTPGMTYAEKILETGMTFTTSTVAPFNLMEKLNLSTCCVAKANFGAL